ncbi:DUF4367 domain-containing protein [Sedimentibacter hydroxybenzoicus DSM 7310]|uniref:DUF4367 domain-containing protein n=1 Tax=Sedimentibacter hydroxybenzoicus DSM 7310 TaxID=1123245 RepID=A0A974BJ15_SEDHY|nr:DUF4367 domain-containing protein [Sedimentibacter hydroxybenzoicus]NYB73535.1 DUF4367 domain-containing protein [Sedimentibacter hydroxybenzoicus DSM 7310]
MKNNFNDEYGEILLRKAAILLSEEDKKIYEKFQNDETIVNPNQEELDIKILGMIKDYEKKEKRKKNFILLKKVSLKVAVFIGVLAIGFAITFTTVEAFKVTVLNFIFEQKEKFTLISLSDNSNGDIQTKLDTKYYPHYLPEGYEIKNTFITDVRVEILYANKNNEIFSYSYFGTDAETGIDTENRTITNVGINGFEGNIFSKDGHRILVFNSDEYIFVVDGYMTQAEIIKVAESIKK